MKIDKNDCKSTQIETQKWNTAKKKKQQFQLYLLYEKTLNQSDINI